ncbi:MAG TPA: hypothetical protein PLH23_04790 [Hyphomonadaceae bacterium]|nr:hypothetical protein [Hyphomonadaceae bacterium]HPI47563.1 hypothetical protein [Hyphomonadaceae bacterium]
MTETLGHPDFAARLQVALKAFGGFLAKAAFGVFLLVAAFAALVATTFIGLMLAIAAVFLTFARPRRKPARRTDDGSPSTLEAKRTADGWVIEI